MNDSGRSPCTTSTRIVQSRTDSRNGSELQASRIRLGCSSQGGQALGECREKGGLELGKGLVRDMSTSTPFSFFQALNRQQEPCFLSKLLLYKERGCLRARILELPPALHPAGCAFPRHQGTCHGTPWAGAALVQPAGAGLESPALHRASAAPYGHKSMSHLLLGPQESPSSLQCGGTWRMLPVVSSKSKTEDLQVAPGRQNQSKPRPNGSNSLLA